MVCQGVPFTLEYHGDILLPFQRRPGHGFFITALFVRANAAETRIE